MVYLSHSAGSGQPGTWYEGTETRHAEHLDNGPGRLDLLEPASDWIPAGHRRRNPLPGIPSQNPCRQLDERSRLAMPQLVTDGEHRRLNHVPDCNALRGVPKQAP